MKHLKQRIEKLKAEISQTRMEKDSYLQQFHGHGDGSFPMQQSSTPYDDRHLPAIYDAVGQIGGDGAVPATVQPPTQPESRRR